MRIRRCLAIYAVNLLCLSLLQLQIPSLGFAAPPLSSDDMSRGCEDSTSERSFINSQNGPCTSLWSEELQQLYRIPDDTETQGSFRWGPYEMSEFELSLLYPPFERRPLWGY